MHEEFWHSRWAEGRTGWHLSEVNDLLQRHWQALQLKPGARVLVPLCGRSLDMGWLESVGHDVVGVELSRLACTGYFADRGLVPQIRREGGFEVFSSGRVSLLCGDALAVSSHLLAQIDAVYDRAALIALPPAMRRRYLDRLYARLPPGCRGLLITIEYDQGEREGPPFAVDEGEVRQLFEPGWRVDVLERRDILDEEPRFRDEGLSALSTAVYRLTQRLASRP